jgi:hypothetical protein
MERDAHSAQIRRRNGKPKRKDSAPLIRKASLFSSNIVGAMGF